MIEVTCYEQGYEVGTTDIPADCLVIGYVIEAYRGVIEAIDVDSETGSDADVHIRYL